VSKKKWGSHARPGLNASTVCVLSLEQSAYSKEIAEESKDTHSRRCTPQDLCSVIGQVDAARMWETRSRTKERILNIYRCFFSKIKDHTEDRYVD
jgi:hypothetical protein